MEVGQKVTEYWIDKYKNSMNVFRSSISFYDSLPNVCVCVLYILVELSNNIKMFVLKQSKLNQGIVIFYTYAWEYISYIADKFGVMFDGKIKIVFFFILGPNEKENFFEEN